MLLDKLIKLIQDPYIALFITLCLGYLVGKIKYKTFVLGGISGSLIMGVVIGQVGINISPAIGSIFFALFLYAVGYQGGASFFKSLNRQTLVQLISATLTCVLGLLTVLIFAWMFHLDRGIAAGLGAGGLTQSAMIGSANDAISQLSLPQSAIHAMQTNVAVGYAVCYIFGSFGPIILLATIFPLIMRWNLRKEAIALASEQTGGHPLLEPGQFNAISPFSTRVYQVNDQALAVGKHLLTLYADKKPRIVIETLLRNNQIIETTPETVIQSGDIIAVTAHSDDFHHIANQLGQEIDKPAQLNLVEERRSFILTNKEIIGKSIKNVIHSISAEQYYGAFIAEISRFGEKLPLTGDLVLKRGDEITLVGKPKDLDPITNKMGKVITKAPITDFIFFGLGMAIGFLIGMISFHIFGVSITLGSGVGCLLSGLLFGWFRSVKPQYGALPEGASNFLRDFGLAVFVATVGLTAGPQAIEAIKSNGLTLFFLGIGVTLIPQILTFYISYYLLRIKNPIVLLSTIAGGRSANPGFAALLEKAGNSTPVIPFTSTYVLANIWLTLWGPIIIGLVTTNV
ncbi:MAG: aspartate-alanine antiporter [Gammaproteobacteria bacterium]|nr:MAG: aspartate-alanine antiporter [Gammaproteobacteria bacterium]UTW41758.1 aspartate-alanine antiporter [bacterium SCSIO 12844]